MQISPPNRDRTPEGSRLPDVVAAWQQDVGEGAWRVNIIIMISFICSTQTEQNRAQTYDDSDTSAFLC